MPECTRRHVLAGLLGLAGAGAAGAYVQRSDGDGQAALGGATPEQDVGVIDLLVILAEDDQELRGTHSYHGIDWREGGSLVWREGATFHFTEMP